MGQRSFELPSLILILLVVVVIVAVLLQEAVQHALAAGLVNEEVVVLHDIIKSGQIAH
jgi:preprotein translocase subunit SecG